MATTAFGALNTLLIGAFLPATEVAYWSVCMQLIGAVQTMYTPITDGIYPEMIKTKSWKFIKRLLMIFMPIVFAGSAFSIAVAPYVLQIVGGEQYVAATSLFRALVPVLISVSGNRAGLADIGRTGQGRTGDKNNNSVCRCSGGKPAIADCNGAFYRDVDRGIPLCNGVCPYGKPRMVLLEISERVLLNIYLVKLKKLKHIMQIVEADYGGRNKRNARKCNDQKKI